MVGGYPAKEGNHAGVWACHGDSQVRGSIEAKAVKRIIHSPKFTDSHKTVLSHDESLCSVTEVAPLDKTVNVSEYDAAFAGDTPEVIVELDDRDAGPLGCCCGCKIEGCHA